MSFSNGLGELGLGELGLGEMGGHQNMPHHLNCSYALARIIYTSDDNFVLELYYSRYFCLIDLFQLSIFDCH